MSLKHLSYYDFLDLWERSYSMYYLKVKEMVLSVFAINTSEDIGGVCNCSVKLLQPIYWIHKQIF